MTTGRAVPNSELEAYCVYRNFDAAPPRQVQFDRHYLLYSARGTMRLQAGDQQWILLPTRAALIPAGLPISIDIRSVTTCCSVLFSADFVDPPVQHCRVFSITSVAREMIWYTRQWGPDSGALSIMAISFFRALALICFELAERPSKMWLPAGRSRRMKNALLFVEKHMSDNTSFSELASHVGISERALSRRFSEECGMTWRQIRRRMRMISAMEKLSQSDEQLISIAFSIGYDSVSAFSRAFSEFADQTPSAYRELYSQNENWQED